MQKSTHTSKHHFSISKSSRPTYWNLLSILSRKPWSLLFPVQKSRMVRKNSHYICYCTEFKCYFPEICTCLAPGEKEEKKGEVV